MPKSVYTVELDGKQYDIEGDRPPTEAEARAAIGATAAPSAPPSPPQPASSSLTHTMADKLAAVLPTAGGVVGGIVGGIPGAALGGAAGKGYQTAIEKIGEIPGAVKDVAANLVHQPAATVSGFAQGVKQGAQDTAIAGAGQGAGQALGEGAVAAGGSLAKWLMNRATTRVTAQLAREFPNLSDTLLDNALTVSEGGYAKAKTLLMAAKGKATATLAAAEQSGGMVPVELTPDLAESLKTALLEKAVKAGQVPPPAVGQPVTSALQRLTGPMKTLFQQIEFAADGSVPLLLKPSEADLFKTQLQKESRALYLNRFAPNGAKAMEQDATLRADYASKLNEALDGVASGYKAANAEAQPLIGAVRGLKQAIRPSGNLYQAMVRPAVGAVMGGTLGQREGGGVGAAVGSVLGAAATSPAGMSREALILAHPAMQAVLRQIPKPFAQKVTDVLAEILGETGQSSPPPGANR